MEKPKYKVGDVLRYDIGLGERTMVIVSIDYLYGKPIYFDKDGTWVDDKVITGVAEPVKTTEDRVKDLLWDSPRVRGMYSRDEMIRLGVSCMQEQHRTDVAAACNAFCGMCSCRDACKANGCTWVDCANLKPVRDALVMI